MKKSSTLTTTTSMPTSPTLSAQTLSASKMSLSSSNSSRSGGRASSCQSHGPIRPGSGCVDAIKAKREEIEVDTLLEKAKFYTSVCLGKWESYQRERERVRPSISHYMLQVRLPYCRCSHFCSWYLLSSIPPSQRSLPTTIRCRLRALSLITSMRRASRTAAGAHAARAAPHHSQSKWRLAPQHYRLTCCLPSSSRCHQLFVNYTRIPFSEWERNPRDLERVNWDVSYTKFLINSEGCGYPPTTNCSVFARQYGWVILDKPFSFILC